MSRRTQRSLQALVLAGWGLFLLHQSGSGALDGYVDGRLAALALPAAIGFLALARIVLPERSVSEAAVPIAPGALASPAHNQGEARGGAEGWWLVVVVAPLIVGLALPARPLGSSAIASRGINMSALLSGGNTAPAPLAVPSTERTILDWVRAVRDAGDTPQFAGEAADVVGFVHHDTGLADGQFLLSRFVVTCCWADATAVGMLVSWHGSEALEADTWVQVRGPVAVGTHAGRPIPLVAAETLEGVEAPAHPYLSR
jgi:uncharacterized repeat protein (TIGR03943 family)